MIAFENRDKTILEYIDLSIFKNITIFDSKLIQENQKLYIDFNDNNYKPFFIDFSSPTLLKRIAEIGKNNELIKSLGLKNNYNPVIIDTTAGLGRDSFLIASKGMQVTMLERNPVIYYLLKNALDIAIQDNKISHIIKNMKLLNIDSLDYIKNLDIKPDIIYIDPMFPKSKKSRLVKKEMQIFHKVVGNDLDSDSLLEASIAKAKNRVIVKRMLKDEYLANKKPNFEIKGSTIRFDIYNCLIY